VTGEPLVIGVGNPWRGDDAAGLAVASRLRERETGMRVLAHEGEPLDLLERWDGEERVILVDAVSSGAPPGTIHRVEVAERSLAAELGRGSTHALGVREAVELARTLGRLPAQLLIIGIEGRGFAAGDGLSPEVESSVDRVVTELGRASGR
jgi:hydrogenase maturation protease